MNMKNVVICGLIIFFMAIFTSFVMCDYLIETQIKTTNRTKATTIAEMHKIEQALVARSGRNREGVAFMINLLQDFANNNERRITALEKQLPNKK